jgi:hypothetical protein
LNFLHLQLYHFEWNQKSPWRKRKFLN